MANIPKKLDLMLIQKRAKTFQEISSDVKLLQERLEDMLTAIDSNAIDYKNGKISKEFFEENDARLREESAELVKKINSSVNVGMKLMNEIIKQMEIIKST